MRVAVYILLIVLASGLFLTRPKSTTTTTGSMRSSTPLTPVNAQGAGFEFNHWPFPGDQPGQLQVLNNLGSQGWMECFTRVGDSEVYCSRPFEWSTTMAWKSWEIAKRQTDITPLLNLAGPDNYDQCFDWQGRRLWCSRPAP